MDYINIYNDYIHNIYADMKYIYSGTSPKEFGQRYIGSNIQRKRAIMRKRGLLKKAA